MDSQENQPAPRNNPSKRLKEGPSSKMIASSHLRSAGCDADMPGRHCGWGHKRVFLKKREKDKGEHERCFRQMLAKELPVTQSKSNLASSCKTGYSCVLRVRGAWQFKSGVSRC